MHPLTGGIPRPALRLAPLLRAAGLGPWWCLLAVLAALAAAPGGHPGPPRSAAGPPAAATHVPARRDGGLAAAAGRDARALLAADRTSLRSGARRTDPGVRTVPRTPDSSGRRPLPLRDLPLPAGAVRLPLLLRGRLPPARENAAARDGTLSSAGSGVPPPPLA